MNNHEVVELMHTILGTLEANLVTERAKLSVPEISGGHITGTAYASTLFAIDTVIHCVRATIENLPKQ
jgi:hypothetical protein